MTAETQTATTPVISTEQQQLLKKIEKRLNARAKRSAWYAFSILAVIIVLAVMSAVIIIGVVKKAGDDVRYISFSEIEASEDLLKLHGTYASSVAQRYQYGQATFGELATTTQDYFDLERTYYRDLADIASNSEEKFRVEGKLVTPTLLNRLVDNLRNEQIHAEQIYRSTAERFSSGVGSELDITIAKAYLRKTASMLDRYERYAHELGITLKLSVVTSPFKGWPFGNAVTQVAMAASKPAPGFEAIVQSVSEGPVTVASAIGNGDAQDSIDDVMAALESGGDLSDVLEATAAGSGGASYDGIYTSKVDAFLSAPISDRFQQLIFYSTRLTSVLLIALIIKFLVPLFRYLLRLSTFYLARADAMSLGSDIESISKASALFTPVHDFDPGKVELGIEGVAEKVAGRVIGG